MIPEPQVSECVETRWFYVDSCVVYRDDESIEVIVGGHLTGVFGPRDVYARNLLLIALSMDPTFKKGALARAFKITDERLRQVRRVVEEGGLEALPAKACGGREPKLKNESRDKVLKLFAEGHRPVRVFRDHGKSLGVSYTTILRLHQSCPGRGREEVHEEVGKSTTQLSLVSHDAAQTTGTPGLPSSGLGNSTLCDDEGVAAAAVRGGKMVQHAGGLLLVALIHSYGLYEAAMKGWEASDRWRDRLRMAIDAVILALGIGQKCVEGVRRLETSTAPILLRCNHMPSESWVRRIVKRYVDGSGMANKLHLRMTGVYLDSARSAEDAPAVFYVDNHMRSYTGKHTIRKGWRMQDKRAVPGVTDYYVHDEDGRPVFRVEAPSHDSLTDWLSPIAEIMRGGLEDGQRILLAFDRAGAFPENMANLRDTGVEFVTYERKPYQTLPKSAFTEEVKMADGEVFLVHEERLANLGKSRGRVRRICLLTADGHQVNLLAASKEPAWRLIEIITGRWVQENGFKHGKERWGINQLDRRKTVDYAPGTIIPNPARRRLELSIKIVSEREGNLRNKLARLDAESLKRPPLLAQLDDCLARLAELSAQRPHLPTHAPVEETVLADELVYHDPHYKTVIDTIRIACANAEADLALCLGEHLRKPAEAKKVLSNVFGSPGDIRVTDNAITIALHLTARNDEREAIDQLFQEINDRKLPLPGDTHNRPLHFKPQI
jgi:hypothetical protein